MLDSLPSIRQAAFVVGLVYTLSKYSRVEVVKQLDLLVVKCKYYVTYCVH